MARILLMLLVVCLPFRLEAATAAPGTTIKVDRTRGTADVDIVNARLSDVVQLASLYSGVLIEGVVPARSVSMSINDVPVTELVEQIAARAGLSLVNQGGRYRLVDSREPLVSLEVVQGEVQEIVESLARQCGIRNVMIDPGMEQRGTFRFDRVPCGTAFRVVLGTMGLGGELHPNSILVVRAQR